MTAYRQQETTLKVIHVLANNTQVDDIKGKKVPLSNNVYFVCQSIEQRGSWGDGENKKAADCSRNNPCDSGNQPLQYRRAQ